MIGIEMKEKIEENDGKLCGIITVERDHFLLVHDYFAVVLNAAQELAQKSKELGEPLSREECAGRLLMVAMIQMEQYAHENPDSIEEMMMDVKMREAAVHKNVSHTLDTMYG